MRDIIYSIICTSESAIKSNTYLISAYRFKYQILVINHYNEWVINTKFYVTDGFSKTKAILEELGWKEKNLKLERSSTWKFHIWFSERTYSQVTCHGSRAQVVPLNKIKKFVLNNSEHVQVTCSTTYK